MEKHTPHHKLTLIKQCIEQGRYRFTQSALDGGDEMGFDRPGMAHVITQLTQQDFYKSMTTYLGHKVWQDVYRPTTSLGLAYIKLTLIDDLLIVSFKER